MKQGTRFETFAVPDGPMVLLDANFFGSVAAHWRLTLAEAQDLHARLGTAIGALRLGKALADGSDPRAVEWRKLLLRAFVLDLPEADVCIMFDLTPEQYRQIGRER